MNTEPVDDKFRAGNLTFADAREPTSPKPAFDPIRRAAELRSGGHPIEPGTTGENLTISGLDWSLIRTGTRMRVGGATLEITGPAHPCKNIAGSFADADFSRLSPKIHPGRSRLYARVLVPGWICAGDPVACVPEPAAPRRE